MLRAILFLCFVSTSVAQFIRQCGCNELLPCKNQAKMGIMQCADQCQNHVASMGASYAAMRQCLISKEPMINSVIRCNENQMGNACSRNGGGMVPKRYPETLQLAAYTEINNILARSGLQAEARSFLAVGKKFASCMMKCAKRGPGVCFKKLNCGLALPADSVLVQTTKQCAINSGFNTSGVQQLCYCLANSGIRGLGPLCARIRIS